MYISPEIVSKIMDVICWIFWMFIGMKLFLLK